MHARLANFALIAVLLAGPTTFAADQTVRGRVVGPDGAGIPRAVVFVDAPASPADSRPAAAVMDQYNKTFVPAVLPIAVGTEVKFPNRDQIRHHVYSFSRPKRFELPLYKGEDAEPVTFDKVGVVTIGCNIHDWMSAVILVLPSEKFAVTDDQGRFALTGLDSGEYSFTAWHARSREKTDDVMQRVRLAGSDAPELTFQLRLAPVRARPAARGARWE